MANGRVYYVMVPEDATVLCCLKLGMLSLPPRVLFFFLESACKAQYLLEAVVQNQSLMLGVAISAIHSS